jgi:DNA primase
MRYTPQFLDELKARLPVSEVVGRRIKLARAGREWKGLSPFNKEKTPSFFVNDHKQAWFDFSSGKNGSIFDFVMETEGVSFPEAVERRAGLAGVPLPKVSREEEARDARRKTLHEVMELASKYFEATLAARAGAKGRGYLADRGIEPATQLAFRLGYAPPERFALKEHLGGQGIPVPDMIEAGLLVAGDEIPVPYDRFRDRVMFPIADLRGRVIAFGGRALEKDAQAKYLNSPETPLFHTGATLYNIAGARQAAHDGAQKGMPVIAVEGYVDVIAMVTSGFPATVAPLGTALTEDQLGLIWKMADEPVLCFDGDGAGLRAALEARIKEVTAAIRAESVRRYYRQDFAERLGQLFAPAVTPGRERSGGQNWRGEGGRGQNFQRRGQGQGYGAQGYGARNGLPQRGASGRPGPYVVASQQLAASPVHRGHRASLPRRDALILQAALNHPWLLHDHLEELSQLEFRNADSERLKGALIDIAARAEVLDSGTVRAELAAQGLGPVLERLSAAITTVSVWGAELDAAPEDVLVTWSQLVALHRQWHSLVKELKDAETALGQDSNESNYLRLVDVKARLSRVEGTEALIEGFGASSGRGVRGL